MNDQLTVGGLFSGIGGWELGLERAGMRVVWHCEQDRFCQRVLAQHWPDVPCHEDVRLLVAEGRPAEDPVSVSVPYVDVLCGGFPCQDLSVAGKGAGIDGARSGLWAEYARLVGELRPRYVLVENVTDLLAGPGKRWDRAPVGRVLGDLATLGYDAEWDCLSASAFGAPHRRDRIWIVAYPSRDLPAGSAPTGAKRQRTWQSGERSGTLADTEITRLEGAGLRGRPADGGADMADPTSEGSPDRHAGAVQGRPIDGRPTLQPERRSGAVPDPEGERRPAQRPQRTVEAGADDHVAANGGHWSAEPDVGRVADGVPARVDRLRSLGNALVPQIAEWIGQRILEWEALSVR